MTQQRDASPIGDAWTLVPSLHLPEFRFSASAIQQAIKRGAQLLGKSAVQGTTEETQFGYFLSKLTHGFSCYFFELISIDTETDTAVVKTESVFSSVEQINDQISCFIRVLFGKTIQIQIFLRLITILSNQSILKFCFHWVTQSLFKYL